jgi:diguanylate cyclase (GGDEF)-like protein
MLAHIKNSKRRRYIRYAIELEAILKIEASISLQCTILDFCAGGLFLGFKSPNADISLHKNVKIQFVVSMEDGRKDFEINAQIVHVAGQGIGVATETVPPLVWNALKNAATARSKNLFASQSDSTPTELNRENFRNAFKQLLIEKLPPLIAKFYESVSGDLEQANKHFEYFENRSVFDDFITTLNLNREVFVSEFCSSIIDQVDLITEVRQKKENIKFDDSVSLVEKEDFEDWLIMSAVIRKINLHYEDKINQLIREFARVLGRQKEAFNNPVSPATLCNSFRDVVLQFKFSNKIKIAIYNIFENVLIKGWDDLFEHARVLLSEYDAADIVLPDSGYQSEQSGGENLKFNPLSPDDKRHIQSQSGRQQWISPGDKALVSDVSEQKDRQSVIQIAGKLLDILNETDVVSAKIAPHGFSEDKVGGHFKTYPCFSSNDVVNAISKIQNTLHYDNAIHIDSAALQKRLENNLKSSGNDSKSLASSDIHHLEVYGKFFETLFKDFNFSSEIKHYLESIHLPLLSLPLQGNDFLNSDLHPVRNIINQIAALDSAVKSNRIIKNINVKNTVDKLIGRITREANSNPGVFAEVEHELEVVAQQVTKSDQSIIGRIVETYDGQQKLEIARRSVQREIDNRIAGKSVPAVIPLLLKSGWQQLMVLAELNNEKYKDEKLKYLEVIDDLIFWLYEQESMLKIQSGSIQKTIEFIQNNLKTVCSDVTQRNRVIEELTALLLGVGQPKIRKRLEVVKIAPITPDDKAVLQSTEDEWIIQVEQLHVGDWLRIVQGSIGFEPMRLVWIGDVTELYVFVNRDGLNKLELNKEELSNLLKNGAASKIENLDAPLIDRATNLMLQKMHEKLIYNATHDSVTNLFTRDEFVKQLNNEMTKLGDYRHMLCHIEVIDFRVIMNVCGSSGSNQLLKSLTELMIGQLRNEDLFARLGDKSFAILFKNCSADEGFENSKNLVKLIGDTHFQWEGKSFSIGTSMGLVPFDENCYDVRQLLQQADSASISAERSGQGPILMFKDDDENIKRQNKLHEWIGRIDNVFSQNRLFLRCQMIAPIDAHDNKRQHYEILLGVRDDNGNIIPPDHFIPAVERYKRMPEIDRWIIENVFEWIQQHDDEFDKIDGFSINLSGQSINRHEFLEWLTAFVRNSKVPTEKLVFEVTETVVAENLVFTNRFIETIRQFGCKFSLDDFGSGYSSYSYLKNLHIDYLKIDGAFVRDIAKNKADIAIVKSMNEIAHSLGLKTIAEYVENDEILQIIKEIGVDYAQGYLIHKPIALTELKIIPERAFFSFDDTDYWGF